MSSLIAEHRETRNQWLAERTELESRVAQLNTLKTQFQGSFIKKEKDFEKLQSQLAKVVKDSNRGQKAVITVSVPLKKNLTQSSAGAAASKATLKDAELIAAQRTIAALQVWALFSTFFTFVMNLL